MAKSNKALSRKDQTPPDPKNRRAFENWLFKQPSEWATTIGVRTALRVIPLANGANETEEVFLWLFRATAIAWLAAKYPKLDATDARNSAVESINSAAKAARSDITTIIIIAAANATHANSAAAAQAISDSARTPSDKAAIYDAVKIDAQRLHNGVVTAEQLARDHLWPFPAPARAHYRGRKARRRSTQRSRDGYVRCGLIQFR